jgi:hypothetical protein
MHKIHDGQLMRTPIWCCLNIFFKQSKPQNEAQIYINIEPHQFFVNVSRQRYLHQLDILKEQAIAILTSLNGSFAKLNRFPVYKPVAAQDPISATSV